MNTNKVAVISGATSEMARELLKAYIEEGVAVIPITRNKSKLLEYFPDQANYIEPHVVETDIVDYEQTRDRLDAAITGLGGRVDYLINAVGSFSAGTITELEAADFVGTFNINLLAIFNTTKIVVPYMIDRSKGAIVNVASILGYQSLPDTPLFTLCRC